MEFVFCACIVGIALIWIREFLCKFMQYRVRTRYYRAFGYNSIVAHMNGEELCELLEYMEAEGVPR